MLCVRNHVERKRLFCWVKLVQTFQASLARVIESASICASDLYSRNAPVHDIQLPDSIVHTRTRTSIFWLLTRRVSAPLVCAPRPQEFSERTHADHRYMITYPFPAALRACLHACIRFGTYATACPRQPRHVCVNFFPGLATWRVKLPH